MCAEEVVMLLLMFPRFGDVDRNPAGGIDVELSPAVVPGDIRARLVGGQRESDLEACRNFLRTSHRHEDRVEVRAVAALRIAGPERVSMAPAGAGLVVLHGAENVLVDVPGLF